ncbi:hypothetical protein [Aliiruegeria lutimaris]|uniref:Uncharacterized protein n=1 Tax=Aliiruegeria lutimaris TaxID=571298 RepID=A0A1G9PEW7_9RHOB|nr:hypothetical protein [Aliiruegeria lutimaris]SDL97366.1 hypothetical protein SAMN04488026_11402 [Aliiruegeria lutimaris]
MATDRQIAANQANAVKSTGPKTKKGKNASARNAIKHGLTMPPPQDEVLQWMKIILNTADLSLDTLGDDPFSHATLRLAEAEAQHERATSAEREAAAKLARYAKSHQETDLLKLDFEDMDDPAVLTAMLKGQHDAFTLGGLKILLASNTNRIPRLVGKLETINRYVRQAERQKARALVAWQKAKKLSA